MAGAAVKKYGIIPDALCRDEHEQPCPCCGRYIGEVGGFHREIGLVCSGCWGLLDMPTLPGMMPVAFEEGWGYRTKRPTGRG